MLWRGYSVPQIFVKMDVCHVVERSSIFQDGANSRAIKERSSLIFAFVVSA